MLVMTTASDIISNADASNSNLCVKTIGLSGAQLTAGRSRGIYFKNVHGFTISGVDMESMRSHGVFIDDGSDNGQILANTCNGVAIGSCFLLGNTPGLAMVSNITVSNNTVSNVQVANGIFVTGSKNGQPTNHITITNNALQCVRDTSIEIGDGSQFVFVPDEDSDHVFGGCHRAGGIVFHPNNTASPMAAAENMIGIFVWNKLGDSEPFQDVTINQNTVTGFAGITSSGISWSSDAPNSSDLFITNNTSTGNLHNFYARTNNIINLVFTGNVGQ